MKTAYRENFWVVVAFVCIGLSLLRPQPTADGGKVLYVVADSSVGHLILPIVDQLTADSSFVTADSFCIDDSCYSTLSGWWRKHREDMRQSMTNHSSP